MNSEYVPDLASDDYQPFKSGLKTGYLTHDGHISQIPGLSPTISTHTDKRARGRRFAVLDSDSAYVKLAKRGGHKGLLWHDDAGSSRPISCKTPEEFCRESGDFSKPSTIKNEEEEEEEEEENPGALQPLEPPVETNTMSALESNNGSSEGKEKCAYVDHNQKELLKPPYKANKYKRVIFDKNPPPVDMTKLLSFGYVDDSKPVDDNKLEDSQMDTYKMSGLQDK